MKLPKLSQRRLLIGISAAAAIIILLLVASDQDEFVRVLRQANWRPLFPAIVFTIVSYICVGLSFALVSEAIGVSMPRRALTEVGFISVILNHVLSTGGLAGYSLRYLMMASYGIGMKEVVAASILHFYLTSLDMLSMLPVGFFYVLRNATMAKGVTIALGIMTGFMTLVAIAATLLIFSNRWREPLLAFFGRFITKTINRDVESPLDRFDQFLAQSVQSLRSDLRDLLTIMILTYVDWVASVMVLMFCFESLGMKVPFLVVMSGFVIGVMAGVLSMVPGGFGVQEGSMAGIFALLGVSFTGAILASILFRIIYYILPYFLSLGFYGPLVQKAGASQNVQD